MRGKVITEIFQKDVNKDHPRLCGEKLQLLKSRTRFLGSPPPMRGKAEAFAVADFFVGITPAYAGKSRFWF